LPYTFNFHNSVKLIEELKHIDITPHTRLCFFSILATCIPVSLKKR
jgi:hypothetical protein